jgi:hypothetical protein
MDRAILKKNSMKKYPTFKERSSAGQQLRELRLFQELLRNSDTLQAYYHGKAFEIANGLQAWIDALERTLQD